MFLKNAFKSLAVFIFCLFKIVSAAIGQTPQDNKPAPDVFIHTGFENASPLNWEADSAGRIIISLVYDHERFSLNRANNHWHFKVEAPVGKEVTLILQNFDNIWNNIHASPISKQSPAVISFDGKTWESRPTEYIEGNRMLIRLKMTAPSAYIASIEPYRISDLDKLLARIKNHKLVTITPIGKTAEGRSLEIIKIGNEKAPRRIFLRGRAHAFEAGGNWTLEGLIDRLLKDDADMKLYLKRYCVYILPMTNKDGVARGKTRFNVNGYDLNRKWDKAADSLIAPENYYLEKWLTKMGAAGKKPDLGIDVHNDAGGNLHISRPDGDITTYRANMARLDSLLRKYTWYTEGSTKPGFRNPGTLGEGFMERFGIEALVYELNYEWVEGLKKAPLAADWLSLGGKLPEVFYHYFEK
ncbi:peptidase M14 [Dyadobacter sp. CY327]|uniref:M14-type cytosolic carboxypeptidase n=1 Tax=Dyadobacter sp. CY327 TaxID=2907301 RepID=UPI001F47BCC1|nr:M14-type cytosolic carboxypeptidase [Dyadobacter sp. CY327]MCE7073006.1 peptidase M14 [Dyadobacter sp. CY327]